MPRPNKAAHVLNSLLIREGQARLLSTFPPFSAFPSTISLLNDARRVEYFRQQLFVN
jgi:hypothetical protein